MKALFNGVIQFSTLDGWWDEAWKSDNSLGWAIGKGEDYDDYDYQDQVELQTLYSILEKDIIPDFYDRSQNFVPMIWVARMKQAIIELGPIFNSNRMVEDYFNNSYTQAYRSLTALCADNFAPSHELAKLHMDIMTRWSGVQLNSVVSEQRDLLYVGDKVQVSVNVFTNGIALENLLVEIYSGKLGQDNSFIERLTTPMQPHGPIKDGWQTYTGMMPAVNTGRYGFNVRATPMHPLLPNQNFGLIRWAN
jgi:starch phosphorylase